MLRVASTDGLVNQMADGVLRVASTDELLYQMADGLLRVASTDVIKTKNPASPRGYFFALYNIHFFFFFSPQIFFRIRIFGHVLGGFWVVRSRQIQKPSKSERVVFFPLQLY